MDRRFDFSNDRVKTPWHEGPKSAAVRTPVDHVVTHPVLDLAASPDGARDRQLLFNDVVEVLDERDGIAFVRAAASGYVGYVDAGKLKAMSQKKTPDHWVASRMTHAYCEPDIKSKELMALSMGTRVLTIGTQSGMVETEVGWIPARHIRSTPENDPVDVAERLLGTPYLWGGNSACGIDCSGLVWIAFLLCGEKLMPDSDLQKKQDGNPIEDGSIARGDLWFWDGHVAIVADDLRLVHANAHHMAVVHEDITKALARIGQTTARKRVSLSRG